MKNFSEFASGVDRLLREARFREARTRLRLAPTAGLTRSARLKLAALYRRAGLSELAVRILFRQVRNPPPLTPASQEEQLEYASCLSQIGAVEEALQILAPLPKTDGSVALTAAHCNVMMWEYAPAIENFRIALGFEKEAYQRYVIEANLAAAYLAEADFAGAETCLNSLLALEDSSGFRTLRGAALQLHGQLAILQAQWPVAEKRLALAKAYLGTHPSHLQGLLIDKWRVFSEIIHYGDTTKNRSQIEGVRRRATELRHWETLRECDRYEATLAPAPELVGRLYFGTPWKSYRQRIAHQFPVPETFRWQLGKGKGTHCFDLDRARATDGTAAPKWQKVAHRVFLALCHDFYRPLGLAVFHHLVYPNEFFNPYSASNRMYQAVFRFREWIKRAELPLAVEIQRGQFRLESARRFEILIHRDPAVRQTPRPLEDLAKRFPSQPFSAKQACGALGISRSHFNKLMASPSAQTVARLGKGKATLYRLMIK